MSFYLRVYLTVHASTGTIFFRIYWADAGTKMIESCDIDGKKRRRIVTNLFHPFGITLDDTRVFWTDWSTKNISYANKFDGES